MDSRVWIVIINWNGWRDTIECLESVFRIDYPNYRVIVCDNASEDGSLEHIKAWAEGRMDVFVPTDNSLRSLSFPPVPKPISYIEYGRAPAEKGGDSTHADARLVLIGTGANLGFAGGNNVGLRYALARDDSDYVWLLNNDTVVHSKALGLMVKRMQESPNAGMCGATVLYYDEPEKVQALGGGVYNRWLGLSSHIGAFRPTGCPAEPERVERQMDYILGACALVSKPFLQNVGLMCEDYFLYYEEVDWALRARGHYSLAYAPESIVYHKEGRATGASNSKQEEKSLTSDFFLIKSRFTLSRKFFPWLLPTVYIGLLVTLVRRIGRGRWWARLWMIARLAMEVRHRGRCSVGEAPRLEESRR
ncbi:MAG: glycosyltransferase family 2 protein [Armatimonadetes bacterium]|nr:glycosyltransferase family 2 protein [Armatimonadota bacterium]